MKWEMERVSNVERKLTIEVSAEVVSSEMEKAYRAVGKKAQLKGFRPGKAPKALLRQYFGDKVKLDVAENLIDGSLGGALQEADLEPVGNFNLERGTVEEGATYSYVATFDVMALPESVDTKDITVEWPDVAVTDEELTARFDELRKMKGELVPVEDRGAELGDTVNVTMSASEDGNVIEGTQTENQDIVLDPDRLLPDLAEGIKGMKDGDEKAVPVAFPEDFPDPNLSGKTCEFQVQVNGLKALELPELDDDFAVDLGLENLAELTERVTEEIQRGKNEEGDKAVHKSLFDQLLEKNPLEVPDTLVQARSQDMMKVFLDNLSRQGLDPSMFGDRLGDQKKTFDEQAERICKERALTRALVESASLSASDDELDARVEEIIADYDEEQKDAVKTQLSGSDTRARLKSQLEYEKLVEYVIGKRPEAASPKEEKSKDEAGDEETTS